MFRLVWKDIKFNGIHVALSIIISLAASILLSYEKIDFSFMAFYLCSMITFTYIVGKACEKDERGSTMDYIKTLPLKIETIVTAKYVLAIITLLLAWLVNQGANLLLPFLNKEPNFLKIAVLITLFGISLIYMGVFLFLYFRYGYSNAQYTIFIMLIGLFIIKSLISRNPNIISRLNANVLPKLFLLLV